MPQLDIVTFILHIKFFLIFFFIIYFNFDLFILPTLLKSIKINTNLLSSKYYYYYFKTQMVQKFYNLITKGWTFFYYIFIISLVFSFNCFILRNRVTRNFIPKIFTKLIDSYWYWVFLFFLIFRIKKNYYLLIHVYHLYWKIMILSFKYLSFYYFDRCF